MNEEKKLSKEIKINKEIFENINSPQIIQDILHLSTESSQIELELQNNTVKSLLSINQNLLPILDNDFNEDNFNPFILSQNKRKDLYRLNFEQINITNNILKEKIEQYNELKQKINEFNKNNKNINNDKLNLEENKKCEKELENQKKEEIIKKLYLINHPFISLFEEKININELKNEIKNEYLNKMKDNTNYKYLSPQNNNLLGLPNFLNYENLIGEEFENIDDDDNDDNDDNEDNEDNEDNAINDDSEVEENNDLPEPILPPFAQIHGPVLPIEHIANQENENNNNNNNDNNNNDNNDNNNDNGNNNDNNDNNNNNGDNNNENIAG